jgi:hypothetical protein
MEKSHNMVYIPLNTNVVDNIPIVAKKLPLVVDNNLIVADNSQTNNITHNFKCDKCYKCYTLQTSLNRHYKSCKGIQNSLECEICHKIYSSRFTLSHHRKTCKNNQLIIKEKLQNNDSIPITTNIQTQNNNIQTQNNTNTQNITINVLKFPEDGDEFDFLSDHIDKETFKKLWDNVKPEIGFRKFSHAILDRPENRIVRKTGGNTKYSKIHQGNNEWELALDKDVYPMLTFQMSCAALQCTHDYKKKVKLIRTDIQKILKYLDDVNTENDDDEPYFKDAVERIQTMVFNMTKQWQKEKEGIEPTASEPAETTELAVVT